MTLEFEVTELHRRLANLILLGQVVETDFSSAIPRLKIKVGELQTAWLAMLTQRAGPDVSCWPLEIGEQVVVLSPSGELSQGVVLGALNQKAAPAAGNQVGVHRQVYGDGAVIEYDRTTHQLSATLPAAATTKIISKGGLTVVGDITVTGNIQSTGDVNITGNMKATGDISDHTRSMKSDREIYNVHTHSGVLPGSSSTAIPQQPQ